MSVVMPEANEAVLPRRAEIVAHLLASVPGEAAM